MGANIVKMSIEHAAEIFGLTRETGMKKAAGFFLSPRKIDSPKGKLIGFVGDNTIAAFLGVLASYLLTFTGRDYPLLKGAAIGNLSWSVMYGIMGQLGATQVKSNDPNTYIMAMISHTTFGIVKMYLLSWMADPGLYKPHFEQLGSPAENIPAHNGSTAKDAHTAPSNP